MTDREELVRTWNDLWTKGMWAAPWSRALEGLTPAQAAWKPRKSNGANGNSIWQIANHIIFWRGYVIDRLLSGGGGTKLSDEEIAARTFEEPLPGSVNDASWRKTVEAFASSHARAGEALAMDTIELDRVRGMPHHDSYHVGQIMTLRSLQGLPPVE